MGGGGGGRRGAGERECKPIQMGWGVGGGRPLTFDVKPCLHWNAEDMGPDVGNTGNKVHRCCVILKPTSSQSYTTESITVVSP